GVVRPSAAASGGLQLRLDRVEQLPDLVSDVRAANPLLRGQYVRAVGHGDARIEEALEGREQLPALRGPLHSEVKDRLFKAFRGGATTRQEPGQVGGRKIAGARGPTVLLELTGLRGREHLVAS